MAEFKEELVINALHSEKAEVGKKYYCSNDLRTLKTAVLIEDKTKIRELISINNINPSENPFYTGTYFDFLYPYEEPPKPRMTNRMLAEWCAKGNGEYSYGSNGTLNYTEYSYNIGKEENEEVADEVKIRSWDSSEWIEPTVDIYERDCKGGK